MMTLNELVEAFEWVVGSREHFYVSNLVLLLLLLCQNSMAKKKIFFGETIKQTFIGVPGNSNSLFEFTDFGVE